jgi:hypothetical protein
MMSSLASLAVSVMLPLRTILLDEAIPGSTFIRFWLLRASESDSRRLSEASSIPPFREPFLSQKHILAKEKRHIGMWNTDVKMQRN